MEKLSENTYAAKPIPIRTGHPGGLRKSLGRLPSWLKNKFLIAVVFFAVWMFFIDEKDIVSNFEHSSKLNELEKSEQHLKKLITDSRQELILLKTNAQSIEKYAREKYMMKKDNEDLFIVKSSLENK